MTVDITKLSSEERAELMQTLAKEKKAERAAREKARKAFEKSNDQSVEELFEEAEEIERLIGRFKQKCHAVMENQKKKLDEYGSIRSDSKGGFSINHTDGKRQLKRRRDTDPVWDGRAKKAVELLRSFLIDQVKKRHKEIFELLMGYLEKNKAGDWDYASVMEFLKHEESFDDERWIEGIKLLKESYSKTFKAFGYEFRTRNIHGKWVSLALNFASA